MAAADGPPGMGRARRLLWRIWPDRNPLRRAADRAERALLVVLFALFAAGIPAAALAVGHWAGLGAAHAARVAAAAQRPVSAHLLHTAPAPVGQANPSSYLVQEPAWWADSAGVRHMATVLVTAGTKAGAVLHEWTDGAGGLTSARIGAASCPAARCWPRVGTGRAADRRAGAGHAGDPPPAGPAAAGRLGRRLDLGRAGVDRPALTARGRPCGPAQAGLTRPGRPA